VADASSATTVQGAAPTVRLGVAGPTRRIDLAVPVWADAATVLAAYQDATGESGPAVLRTSDGSVVEPSRPLTALGLEHGTLLHVGPPQVDDASRAATGPVAHAPTASAWRGRTAVGLAALTVLAGAALSLDLAAGPRAEAAAVLLVVVLLCAGHVRRDPAGWSAAVPALGAAAGLLAGYQDGPGGLFLGIAVAGLVALAVAACLRAVVPLGEEEVLEVWLASAGVLALAALLVLVTDGTATGLLALLLSTAALAALLLPALVVDVADEVLVDLDRLAVTAWSARERPRGGRTRSVVRAETVRAVVRRAQRRVSAGTVAVAVVVGACGPLIALLSPRGLTGDGARVLAFLGAVGLALAARGVRASVPRTGLRLAAGVTVLALGVHLVLRLHAAGADGFALVPALAAGLGGLVALAAAALGRGWRSVWWARAADVAQTLALVLMVAALPVATGLFVWVRQFVS